MGSSTKNEEYMLPGTDPDNLTYKQVKTRKWLVAAILCGGVIIAVGLVVGLSIGLSHKHDKASVEAKTGSEKSRDITKLSSKLGKYRYAAVAADATICSQIGTDILAKKGGSAVDAAIGSLFCMGVANMHSMGIGGGFFATIYDSKTQTVAVLDSREEAPGAATENMFGGNRTLSRFGTLAIAVPGEVMGYWEMHRRYGKLPWADLIEPAIDMCENGFVVAGALGRALNNNRVKTVILNTPSLRELLLNEKTGEVFKNGETLRCIKLAKTLRVLATDGGHSFYNGTIAKDVIADITDAGGIITAMDLQKYQAKWKTPLTLNLHDGLTLHSLPAPSGGGVLSLILNIVEGYKFNNASIQTEEDTIRTYHRIIEAMKFAYAKRTHLGDSDFVDVAGLENNMTSQDYGESLRRKISDEGTFDYKYYGPTFYDDMDPGTAHVSLMDVQGNAVSVTSTINLYLGSGVRGNRTGILFNDEMDDFSFPNITNYFGIPPSPANFIKPGKRPLSSMCPVIILDQHSNVKMVTGASGGSKITSATALVILRALRFGQDLKTATDAQRFHHQLLPEVLQVEAGRFSEAILEGLKSKGHSIKSFSPRSSVVQTVLRQGEYLYGVSDDRKGGTADGY